VPNQSIAASLDTEQIVRENIGWMLSLSKRLMAGDADAAEDVVQDAFVSAFRSVETLKKIESIKPWLHRITVNAALMQLRKKNRLSEQPIDEFLPDFDRNDCRLEDRWSYLASLEDVEKNHNLQNILNDAITKLPADYQLVLQLRDVEGYSTQEVAEALKISNSNAKVRVHRARSAMKKLIEPLLREEDN